MIRNISLFIDQHKEEDGTADEGHEMSSYPAAITSPSQPYGYACNQPAPPGYGAPVNQQQSTTVRVMVPPNNNNKVPQATIMALFTFPPFQNTVIATQPTHMPSVTVVEPRLDPSPAILIFSIVLTIVCTVHLCLPVFLCLTPGLVFAIVVSLVITQSLNAGCLTPLSHAGVCSW